MESINLFLQQNALNNKNFFEQKKVLRKYLLLKRAKKVKLLSDTKFWGEKQFFDALTKLNISYPDELQNKFNVAFFFPIKGELNFLPFAQPNWLLPKIKGNELHWFEYGDGKNNYILNEWQIPEKKDEFCFEYAPSEKKLLCFVPGLAGDAHGHRLGYGHGYYDRFLAANKNIISVLCLPSAEFFFDNLPHETHDVQMNLVVY